MSECNIFLTWSYIAFVKLKTVDDAFTVCVCLKFDLLSKVFVYISTVFFQNLNFVADLFLLVDFPFHFAEFLPLLPASVSRSCTELNCLSPLSLRSLIIFTHQFCSLHLSAPLSSIAELYFLGGVTLLWHFTVFELLCWNLFIDEFVYLLAMRSNSHFLKVQSWYYSERRKQMSVTSSTSNYKYRNTLTLVRVY